MHHHAAHLPFRRGDFLPGAGDDIKHMGNARRRQQLFHLLPGGFIGVLVADDEGLFTAHGLHHGGGFPNRAGADFQVVHRAGVVLPAGAVPALGTNQFR